MVRRVAVAAALAGSMLVGVLVPHALAWTVASTWTGAWGSPALAVSARCSSTGPQAVWAAETGSQFLDIIQVGTIGGRYFAAWGNGTPNGAGSSYVQRDLGPTTSGQHVYAVALSDHRWRLSIDGRVRLVVLDTFRHWRLQYSQVQAEGVLPFGHAACSFTMRHVVYGGQGPQGPSRIGAGWWSVA